MLLIDMDDRSWERFADPTWAHRPSLHEMQLKDSLVLAYEVASNKKRQTVAVHEIVTQAIAAMVPIDVATNRELARILFGELEQDNKRAIRHFRNEHRPLRFRTAGTYIQRLLHSKKVAPSEGGRLWYAVLLHATGADVVAEHFRLNGTISRASFDQHLDSLTAAATVRFDSILGKALTTSSKLPLDRYPLNDVRQFMDYCAFIHWQESKVQRNPLVGIKRLIDLAPVLDAHSFDD
jgi:hypothetical protein